MSGDVDFAIAGMLLLGSLPGIWLAGHIHVRMPKQVTEGIIAAALLGLGLRFLIL